jgi:methyl-accepting chemotaxis protein
MHVASSSEQLSASAQQIGKAGEHAAEITQSLADGSERQLTNLETGATMLHDMSERIGQIARHAEGVLASAQQVSDASNQGEQAIQSSVAQMSTMEAKIIHLSAIVEELGSRSKEVQSILDIMTDIAAETNLLALNASIEAARAGEYGSGFAVVASSVRKLAERSAASAQQISELITHIVGQVELTSSAMDETVRETKRGVELVSSAGASFSDIAASTEITAASIADISEAVRLLSNNSQRLVKSIDDIVKFAGQTAVSAQEMSSFSQQQLAAMEEVDASASFLSSLAERLHSMIERFKVM